MQLHRSSCTQSILPALILSVILSVTLAVCGSSSAHIQRTPTATSQPLSALTVYATGDDGSLIALAAGSGAPRWRAHTGNLSGGKPVVDHGIVYAGAGNFSEVSAFNSATGAALWSVPGSMLSTGPLVEDGRAFVSTSGAPTANQTADYHVSAYRGTDGARLWTARVSSGPLSAPGIVGMAAGNGRL